MQRLGARHRVGRLLEIRRRVLARPVVLVVRAAPRLGGLAGSGNIDLTNTTGAAVTLNVGGNDAGTRYDGVLNGAGSVTKVGNGNLVLGNVGFDQKGDVTAPGYVLYVWRDGAFSYAN